VRRHPTWGAGALLHVPGLAAVAMLVLCHHERWDGRGYPHGLYEDRIPLGARVLAACDAWWAMTSRRPFAAPLAPEEATAELAAGSGHQFDPEVAGALLAEVAGVSLVA
jgi:HD-GYP domain-containing protein (c-di-GMP phosphodiesterase class II)